jgi:HEAT repeat protein
MNKSEAAAAPLIARLDDTDQNVRRAAAQALGQVGSEPAVAPLIARLGDEDRDVRRAAAEALGRIGGEVAMTRFIALLDDEDQGVRRAAVEALGQIGSEVAVARLTALLDDGDQDVRRAALKGASRTLDKADRRLLTRDLDGIVPFLDPHDPIRNQALAVVASKLSMTIKEVRERYEALADQFHLDLEWRPVLRSPSELARHHSAS